MIPVECRAVDRDEGAGRSGREFMNEFRQFTFSGAALTGKKKSVASFGAIFFYEFFAGEREGGDVRKCPRKNLSAPTVSSNGYFRA